MIKILDNDLKLQAILRDVLDCSRYEEINGENTVTFTCVLDDKAQYITDNAIVELDGDYFDIAYYQKKLNEDGTMIVEVEAEHVSYRLNNPEYNKDYFTKIGTPTEVLASILQDTDFTVGDVELSDSVTYSAQEAKSRRQILMEFLALLGGEAVFNKFEISIVQHRGQTEPQIYTTGKNVRVLSKIFDKRETDESGNPLVAYVCEPVQIPNKSVSLGDEVLLIHNDIGVKETLRVVSVATNPYDPLLAEMQIANFVSGLEDQLYKIETNTVTKEKIYNGCKIGAEEGFVAVRSDNKAKTVMNATEGISVYSDIGEGLVKNFFVGTDGRIKARGLDIEGYVTNEGLQTTLGADYVVTGKIYADRIVGGTLSGVTINVDTNATIGNKLILGSSNNNIEFRKATDGHLYLLRSGSFISKFWSNGFWVNGDIAIAPGSEIGIFTNGMGGDTWNSLIKLQSGRITMGKSGITTDLWQYGNIYMGGGYSDYQNSIYNLYSIEGMTQRKLTIKAGNNYGGIDINGGYYGTKFTGNIGFFGYAAVSKTAISDLSSGATPEQTRQKVIDLVNALQSYGLV